MFTIMVAIGALVFVWLLHIELHDSQSIAKEEAFILPKVVYSALIAIIVAALADSLFKIKENNGLVFSGITFYGGLLGAISAIFIQLYFSKMKTQYNTEQWFNILTRPFIAFHICGRIGCFLGGCCYGKVTNGFLGVYFPDNARDNIFHNGNKCYPTQLFEAFAMMIILVAVSRCKNRFKTYIVLYAFSRFIIEFFRGDNRGDLFYVLSPAQVISLAIMLIACITKAIKQNSKTPCASAKHRKK